MHTRERQARARQGVRDEMIVESEREKERVFVFVFLILHCW